jgi:hypothetical protein
LNGNPRDTTHAANGATADGSFVDSDLGSDLRSKVRSILDSDDGWDFG